MSIPATEDKVIGSCRTNSESIVIDIREPDVTIG